MIRLHKIDPKPVLESFVNYFWTYDNADTERGKTRFKILADGLPGLIFQHFEGASVLEEQDAFKLPTSFIYGQATASCTNFAESCLSVTGVSLKAGSLKSLFKTDAFEFTNRLIPLNELATHDINDRLLNTSNQNARIDIISNYLLSKISRKKDTDSIIEDSIKKMNKDTSGTNLSSLNKYYNISERHFERKFKSSIGIRPQQYLRILKFQKAIHQMRMVLPDKLSAIAYDLNYADQSHFIRDFKEFSGLTPKEFLRQDLKFTDFHEQGFTDTPKRLIRCN